MMLYDIGRETDKNEAINIFQKSSIMATQTGKQPAASSHSSISSRGISEKQTGPKRTAPAPRSSSRFWQRLLYFVRHPVDAVWGWLSSVRTAILLIVCITVICLLGIYFVQAPGEVLNDPTAYAGWVQQNALPRYGSLTPIFDWLRFFTIFSSWYFILLLVILVLSIIVCTLNRAPAIWQNFRHPLIRRSDKFYQNALERSEFSHEDAVAWTTAALRRRRYRVQSSVSTDDAPVTYYDSDRLSAAMTQPAVGSAGRNEITYLYASKNTWATLSTFAFHAALVMLLMAGVLSQWHGFPPDSPARKFLPAPLVSLSDSLAGFTFDQALPDGQSAVVYPRGTPHNISFRVNNFTATFDPKTGLPTDYVTDLSVYQDGELVAHSNHLRVNDPLAYDGVIFHQSSLIPSVTITIASSHGCFVCAQPVVLDQTATTNGLQVDYASDVAIAGTSMTMSVLFPHAAGVQLPLVQNPFFLVTVGPPGAPANQDKVLLRLHAGQSGLSFDKQWTVTVNSAKEATVLLVTKDSGSGLIWPIAILLIVSLCITFYFPQRRIWIRIEHERVQMAALREHFTNIRTDLLGVAKEAGENKPLTAILN
jgi:cytochrome c biogenesis protein